MNTTRRSHKLLAAATASALVFAACGSDDDGAEEVVDDAGEEVEEGADEAEDAVDGDGEEAMEEDGDDAEAMEEDGDDGDAASDGSRVSTNIAQPESLTPINNTESEGQQVIDALFTGLVDVDDSNELVFQHAESIETEDNVTFNVTLREGWTFHDGTPVTAQSYVDTWNFGAFGPNAQSTSGQYAQIAGFGDLQCGETEDEDGATVADCEGTPPGAEELAGLTVESDTAFTIEMAEPVPFFLTQLKASAFLPLPEVFFEDPAAYDRAPIGNGPLMMSGEWTDDVEILTDAYPDYQGDDAVSIGGVEFRIYADVNTAVTDLVAGNLDIVNGVPPEQWEQTISQVPNSELSADSGINYIGFPTYAEPFDNPDMRAALSMAIDREAITTGIFDGLREPAQNFYAPVIPGYEEEVCQEWTFDPEEAQARFEAAGGLDALGDSLEVWFNEGGGHDLWIDVIITQWEQNLGIPATNVSFQQLPFAEYLEVADSQGLTGPFRLGWGASYLHPQYYTVLPLQLTADEGGNNAPFWESEDFDAAVAEALTFTTLEESIPAWQDAMGVACAEVPLAPVFFGQNTFAWNDPVGGVFIDAFGVIDYEKLTS